MTRKTITLTTEYGNLKYFEDDGIVFWADNNVWQNWPKLAKKGIVKSISTDGYLAELQCCYKPKITVTTKPQGDTLNITVTTNK